MLIITAKKSQMEIIGLVIIVILISLAMLFFLRFSLTGGSTEKKTYTSAQLTSNMINTIAKTTAIDCSGISVSELYILCYNQDYVDCDGDIYNTQESYSCDIANNTVVKLLNDTLIEWNKDFRFQVFIPDQDTYLYNQSHNFPCSGNTETETYYLPTGFGGLIYLRLNICEG